MHHRVRGAVLGTIAVLFVPRIAAAEDPAPDVAPADGAPTSEPPEVDKKPAATTDEAPMTISEPRRFTWNPYGYLRLQYRIVRNDPNVAFVGRDDGFELQNARIGVLGALGTRVRYNVAIDGAVDERQQVNVPEGKLRVGLRDA